MTKNTTATTTYPMIPIMTSRTGDETTLAYGLRAIAFALRHETIASFDLDTMESALHASIVPVSAKSTKDNPVSPIMFDKLHDLRLQLMAGIKWMTADRAAAQAAPVAPVSKPATSGGSKVVRPITPIRPTPPAGALRF